MRTTKIKITWINERYLGKSKDSYFDKVLLLRQARNVGDIETVNNYALGQLNESQKYGVIYFEKINE